MPAAARYIIMICCTFFLAACEDDLRGTTETDPTIPSVVREAEEDCTRQGGTWGTRGSQLFTCYLPASDANQSCQVASDCESVCLARSRTCAPVTPFLGCHEILTESGTRATRCLN